MTPTDTPVHASPVTALAADVSADIAPAPAAAAAAPVAIAEIVEVAAVVAAETTVTPAAIVAEIAMPAEEKPVEVAPAVTPPVEKGPQGL